MHASTLKKLVLVGVIAVAVALFFAFDLNTYLTLDYLKQSRERFQELYAANTVLVLAAYFCIYVAAVTLQLPGAAVLTLAGGALFGFWTGIIVVSFASTIGATLAFLLARTLLKDWVQRKFGERLAKVNDGVKEEGAFYLFTMRLIPVIPFFVINLVMGLTPMRVFTFYWVSQLGMLPGTAVYVNAGKQLSEIDSLAGIVSPQVLASFILLGLFPLIAKKTLGWYRRRSGKQALGNQE